MKKDENKPKNAQVDWAKNRASWRAEATGGVAFFQPRLFHRVP